MRRVTVEHVGQAVVVRPPCEAALAPLATAIHVAAVHGSRGFQTVARTWPLFDLQRKPWGEQTAIPAGLEPVVVGLLERAGFAIDRGDEPAGQLPPPGALEGRFRGPIDPAFIEFVRANPRGLARVGRGVCPALLVAQVHMAYPGMAIAVAATRRDEVRAFGRRLKDLVPLACWSLGDDFPADPGPLVATTYSGLGDTRVALHRRDILICLDAREALGQRPSDAIGYAERARLYGLLPRDERLAPYDRDRAWALFGFADVDIPRHRYVARPVAAAFLRITGGPAPRGAGLVRLKRASIWRHPARNRRIAGLAAALASGDAPGLAAESPALAASLTGVSSPRVVVLVEGIEHALVLAERLPGWGLLRGAGVLTTGLSRRQRQLLGDRDAMSGGEPGGTIATLAAAAGRDIERADVVVRADGGVGVPEAIAAGLAMRHGTGRPLLVVDFDDRQHPEFRSRSKARRAAYVGLGWSVGGADVPASAVDLFLATRPRGCR